MSGTTRHPRRREVAFVVVVALVGLALWLGGVVGPTRGDDGETRVTHAGARAGWKTLERDGVRVDVPEGWERLASHDCPAPDDEAWGPVGARGCGLGEGVWFPEPTTFDALHEPGVAAWLGEEGPAWAGYVRVGRAVVAAGGDDRDVVRDVLASAGDASVDGGFQPIP